MAKVASRRTVEWLLTMATEYSVAFLVALGGRDGLRSFRFKGA